jgi:hypothetical protein
VRDEIVVDASTACREDVQARIFVQQPDAPHLVGRVGSL